MFDDKPAQELDKEMKKAGNIRFPASLFIPIVFRNKRHVSKTEMSLWLRGEIHLFSRLRIP